MYEHTKLYIETWPNCWLHLLTREMSCTVVTWFQYAAVNVPYLWALFCVPDKLSFFQKNVNIGIPLSKYDKKCFQPKNVTEMPLKYAFNLFPICLEIYFQYNML